MKRVTLTLDPNDWSRSNFTVRDKICEADDPVKVFIGIIRKKLWHHIMQVDEDRARAAINKYRRDDISADLVNEIFLKAA